MRIMRFRAKSSKTYENTWLAACPSRIAKNVPTVFVFYCKNVLEKMEVGLRSPKTRPLKPHLSSGNAENELPEIRIEHHVFRTFSKSEQKRWKKRHGTAAPRFEKRVKTRVFRNVFETSNKNKQPWLDRKTMKTRENAWFWACFELRKPQNEPGQAAPELRNAENEFSEDSGSPKKA